MPHLGAAVLFQFPNLEDGWPAVPKFRGFGHWAAPRRIKLPLSPLRGGGLNQGDELWICRCYMGDVALQRQRK